MSRLIRFYSKPTHIAPGRKGVPAPNPPPRMVMEVQPPKGLRGLISRLFEPRKPVHSFSDRQQSLTRLGGSESTVPSQDRIQCLHAPGATNLLFWYCPDLTFSQVDFERIGPKQAEFTVTRARNPLNLTPWMGYFLQFKDTQSAMTYYEQTIGHELCGFPLKLKFTKPEIQGFTAPLLEKSPGLSRRSHALVLGLPPGFSQTTILRVLWDYDLLDDDDLAVERLPLGDVKYGGNPYLLRFKTEKESERFVRDYDGDVFPYTENKVICEVLD